MKKAVDTYNSVLKFLVAATMIFSMLLIGTSFVDARNYDEPTQCMNCSGSGYCPECDGSGVVTNRYGKKQRCRDCDGTGTCVSCDGKGYW